MLVVGSVTHEIQEGKLCRLAPCPWVLHFPRFFFGFPLDSPYDFGVCELVEVLMHAPLVGLGAPPWVCEIAGSTNFV